MLLKICRFKWFKLSALFLQSFHFLDFLHFQAWSVDDTTKFAQTWMVWDPFRWWTVFRRLKPCIFKRKLVRYINSFVSQVTSWIYLYAKDIRRISPSCFLMEQFNTQFYCCLTGLHLTGGSRAPKVARPMAKCSKSAWTGLASILKRKCQSFKESFSGKKGAKRWK